MCIVVVLFLGGDIATIQVSTVTWSTPGIARAREGAEEEAIEEAESFRGTAMRCSELVAFDRVGEVEAEADSDFVPRRDEEVFVAVGLVEALGGLKKWVRE
jgi:hypothetical protein